MAKHKSKSRKRTHVAEEEDSTIPRTFVFSRGKLSKPAQDLCDDVREMMQPYTATNLKVRPSNRLKDIISVAGPYGVSHLLILSSMGQGTNLRIIKSPQGPTLTFRIAEYTPSQVLRQSQTAPRHVPTDYAYAPLVVLNNFKRDATDITRLTATTLQHMFPPVDPARMGPTDCRRVVLFQRDTAADTILVRHYAVTTQVLGLSEATEKLVRVAEGRAGTHETQKLLDSGVGDLASVSELFMATAPADGTEDPQGTRRSVVRLVEIGPRMRLELLKAEQGVGGGTVLYHRYNEKSAEEREAAHKLAERSRKLRVDVQKELDEAADKHREENLTAAAGAVKQARDDKRKRIAGSAAEKSEKDRARRTGGPSQSKSGGEGQNVGAPRAGERRPRTEASSTSNIPAADDGESRASKRRRRR
jgi:ribosome biogenesis protein SSF1/2